MHDRPILGYHGYCLIIISVSTLDDRFDGLVKKWRYNDCLGIIFFILHEHARRFTRGYYRAGSIR